MARGNGIHRTSARNARMKDADIGNAQAHNEREKSSYVNQDIVPERTPYNVHFKTPTAGYKEMFEQMRSEDVNTIGGFANWVQDWEYTICPHCGKPMKYLAQIQWNTLMDGTEGTLYIEFCPDCQLVSMQHQQT